MSRVPPIEIEHDAPRLADYDWVVTWRGSVLHAPAWDLPEDKHDELEEWARAEWFEAACGRILTMATIPGFTDRMGTKRCDKCCDRLGYPRGVGSPKNDAEIRKLRGWS